MRSHLIIGFICLTLAYSYFYFVIPDCLHDRYSCFGDFTQLAPFKYRVLQPFLERVIDAHPSEEDLLWIDIGLQSMLSTVSVIALYIWLKRWMSNDQALLGVGLFTLAYIISFHFYQRALHTSLEVTSVTLALALLGYKRWMFPFYILISALAAFNRETSLLLIAIYAVYYPSQRRHIVILFMLWVSITAGLHLVLGPAPHQLGLEGTLIYNLDHLFDGMFTNLLFIPFGVAAAIGYRKAPTLLRRLFLLVLIYVLAIIVGASWRESQRLVLPIVPLILPLILIGSYRTDAQLESNKVSLP